MCLLIFISVDVNYFCFMPFCIGWVENFDEITLSCTVKKIEANSCFSTFGKNLKIQNGRHFLEKEIFLKIAKSTFLRYPISVGIGARSFNIDRSSYRTADIDTYYQHFNIETTYKKQTKIKQSNFTP